MRLLEALGHRGIDDQPVAQCRLEKRLKQRARMRLAFRIGLLQQHRPRRGRQGLRQLRKMLAHQRQRELAHHLEAGEPRAEP